MRRFKNILAVYELVPGGDETLEKAVDLAQRNSAHLTVVHASNLFAEEHEKKEERERLLSRIMSGVQLAKGQKSLKVEHGPAVESILKVADEIAADLIITPDQKKGFYAQVMGADTSVELLRRSRCPTWIMRPRVTDGQRCNIVAAVNAGKPNALDCAGNQRILEIAASLAIIENAQLHLVYAWDYEGNEREMMLSELPPGKYEELTEEARRRHRACIIDLVGHVLDDFIDYMPIPERGDPRSVVVDYVNNQNADLLIIDGRIEGALKSALMTNTATHLLRQTDCSVLCTSPVTGASGTSQAAA